MRSFETEFDAATRARLVGAMVLMCGNRTEAEDIAQEALAEAWSRWSRVSRMTSPQAWVWRVAFNAAKARGRRRGAEQRALARVGLPDEGASNDTADQVAIRTALASIPERQRQAIVCRYYMQLSVKETARSMGCAPGTVKALCSQGIDGLRDLGLVDRNEPEVSRGTY